MIVAVFHDVIMSDRRIVARVGFKLIGKDHSMADIAREQSRPDITAVILFKVVGRRGGLDGGGTTRTDEGRECRQGQE